MPANNCQVAISKATHCLKSLQSVSTKNSDVVRTQRPGQENNIWALLVLSTFAFVSFVVATSVSMDLLLLIIRAKTSVMLGSFGAGAWFTICAGGPC